jgi:ADP-dependent phosphofructokinase/glucokinase
MTDKERADIEKRIEAVEKEIAEREAYLAQLKERLKEGVWTSVWTSEGEG